MGLLCAVVRLTSNTLGGYFFAFRQFNKFSTTSRACYEQDLSLYFIYSMLFLLWWVCVWLKAPSHPHGKKILEKTNEKECIRMQYEHTNKLFLSTTIDKTQVNWKQSKGGSLLPSFAALWSLDATLLFPETKELSRRISLCSGSTFLWDLLVYRLPPSRAENCQAI